VLRFLRPGAGEQAGRLPHPASEVPGQVPAVRDLRLHRPAVPVGVRERLRPRRHWHHRRDHRRLRRADDPFRCEHICGPAR
jgi:hypothetical protein